MTHRNNDFVIRIGTPTRESGLSGRWHFCHGIEFAWFGGVAFCSRTHTHARARTYTPYTNLMSALQCEAAHCYHTTSPYPRSPPKGNRRPFRVGQDNRGLGAQEGGDTGAVKGNHTQNRDVSEREGQHTTQQASEI